MSDYYMTTEEVAAALRIEPQTLRYWRHAGKGPASFRVPGTRRVLYAREDVETFIEDARQSNASA
ncbi:helix-turn-helix transcriptional regulator [Nocardioides sp. MH1]|uniref:helix-turn-helix transcriptional regulator n=1 Tax=Nocardioides sp. MH1 TaxID=3242490 RepID=UPI0035225960